MARHLLKTPGLTLRARGPTSFHLACTANKKKKKAITTGSKAIKMLTFSLFVLV